MGTVKKTFGGVDDGETTDTGHDARRLPEGQPPEPLRHPEPAVTPLPEPHRQSDATSKFYEAEKRHAQAAGQTVKGYRAGYIQA